MDLQALLLTLRLASITTAFLLVLSVPLAALLVLGHSRWLALLEAIATLPLVLPPTVLGFFLLVLLGPRTAIGRAIIALLGHPLAFSFSGLVVGSIVYSLPFAVQPLVAGFGAVDMALVDAARLLGAGPARVVFTLFVPLAKRSLLAAGDSHVSAYGWRVRGRAHAGRRYSGRNANSVNPALQPGGKLRLRRRRTNRGHSVDAQHRSAGSDLHRAAGRGEAAVLEFALDARRGHFRLQAKGRFSSAWTVVFGPSRRGQEYASSLACGTRSARPRQGRIRRRNLDGYRSGHLPKTGPTRRRACRATARTVSSHECRGERGDTVLPGSIGSSVPRASTRC